MGIRPFVGNRPEGYGLWREVGWSVLVGAAVLLVGVAGRLEAQATEVTPRLSIAPKVGIALPAGPFSDIADAGPSANLRLSYSLRPGLSLTAMEGTTVCGERTFILWETVAGKRRRICA
jgi:hypothetical protein